MTSLDVKLERDVQAIMEYFHLANNVDVNNLKSIDNNET